MNTVLKNSYITVTGIARNFDWRPKLEIYDIILMTFLVTDVVTKMTL